MRLKNGQFKLFKLFSPGNVFYFDVLAVGIGKISDGAAEVKVHAEPDSAVVQIAHILAGRLSRTPPGPNTGNGSHVRYGRHGKQNNKVVPVFHGCHYYLCFRVSHLCRYEKRYTHFSEICSREKIKSAFPKYWVINGVELDSIEFVETISAICDIFDKEPYCEICWKSLISPVSPTLEQDCGCYNCLNGLKLQ